MRRDDAESTQPLTQIPSPLVGEVSPVTKEIEQVHAPAGRLVGEPTRPPHELLRSSRLVAIASLVSRVTGFIRNIALVSILGFASLNDAYTISNTLPNVVYELLLGGVLSSVMIPS